MSHKYSENCMCQECHDTFTKVLMDALDRGDKAAAKKKKKKK